MTLVTMCKNCLPRHPEKIALRASQGAVHLVMTHSHSLDEAICLQLLMRGDFAYLGLIGIKKQTRAICQKTGRRRGVASDAGSIDLSNWHQ
jgi:xanthine dehydrogenase accessory factor